MTAPLSIHDHRSKTARIAGIIAIVGALQVVMVTTAHAGQLSSDDSSRPSIRRLRKETRISVLRPIRAHGRAAAGYPMAQTLKYTAGTAFRVSGLLNPINWFLR